MGFVVDKVAQGEVFLRVICYFLSITIQPMLCINLSIIVGGQWTSWGPQYFKQDPTAGE
jgi:hypothetical protein